MAETIAQLELQDIVDRLETISVANGYNTDAGSHVFRGRTYIDEDNELPGLTVIENDEQGTEAQVSGTQVRETTGYEVHGLITADPNNPLDAGHQLVADIKRALFQHPSGPEFETLPKSGATLEYLGRQVLSSPLGSELAEVMVQLNVSHSEQYGNPYE